MEFFFFFCGIGGLENPETAIVLSFTDCLGFVGIWIKHLYKICIFGLLELLLLMKSAEFIHELVTKMTLE